MSDDDPYSQQELNTLCRCGAIKGAYAAACQACVTKLGLLGKSLSEMQAWGYGEGMRSTLFREEDYRKK